MPARYRLPIRRDYVLFLLYDQAVSTRFVLYLGQSLPAPCTLLCTFTVENRRNATGLELAVSGPKTPSTSRKTLSLGPRRRRSANQESSNH